MGSGIDFGFGASIDFTATSVFVVVIRIKFTPVIVVVQLANVFIGLGSG
jgi:hypothetical protein